MNEAKPMARRINALLSLAIAFAAWVFVIYNFNPVKAVTYKDVPITYVGEEELALRGYAVSGSGTDTVDVTLNINRTNFNRITSEDITVQADVTSAKEGDNGISLTFTPPEDTTLVRASTSTISVKVSECTSKEVDLAVSYDPSAGVSSDTEPVPDSVGAGRVTVYGTKGTLKKVKCATLMLPAPESESSETHTVIPVAINDEGAVVSHVVIRPGEVTATAHKGVVKTVLLNVVVRDDSGVKKTYKTVKRVNIKGSEAALKKILSVNTEEINLTYIDKGTELPFTVELPEGVYLSSKSTGETLKVKLSK